MVDYYSILLRAVTAPGAGDAHWRRGIYDRSRQMLSTRMRGLEPPPPLADIAAEEARLEAAIERIESELSWTEQHATGKVVARKAGVQKGPKRAPSRQMSLQEALTGRAPAKPVETDPTAADDPFTTDPGALAGPRRFAWAALAIVIAAIGAGGYVFVSSKGHKAAPAQQQAQAPAAPNAAATKLASAGASPSTPPKPQANAGKNGELPPGIDGGPSDPDQQYMFRRQPTFYRTLQPVGTIIIDKLQHFLYLIQPNNVALRYGIAVGEQCANLAGMRHISNMAEWPTWQPPPEMLSRNPNPMPGGPGNPLGARMLQLDDGNSRINGTNAPKTIGNPVSFGCIRLNNDDITDLYGRVKLSTPVVVN
jgi:lipoprotein-anchoring transpeptidase ErfK/SrfK